MKTIAQMELKPGMLLFEDVVDYSGKVLFYRRRCAFR